MKPIICFIDDSPFEHALVAEEIAPLAPDMTFVLAYTFEEAVEALGNRRPALFLLDLWGQDPAVTDPHLPSQEELAREADQIPTLEAVYQGLDTFDGDLYNEFLKRLFSVVDGWRRLFEQACDRIGQNRKYGLANLARARQRYPGVPAVFYTRKSLINDAVAMMRAGIDAIFIKPTGSNDSQTREKTRAYAPQLLGELRELMAGRRPSA